MKICNWCNGEKTLLQPVYHNDYVRELCWKCAGTGYLEDEPKPKVKSLGHLKLIHSK